MPDEKAKSSSQRPKARKPRAVVLDQASKSKNTGHSDAGNKGPADRAPAGAKTTPRRPRAALPDAELVTIPDEAANRDPSGEIAMELTPPPPPKTGRRGIKWGAIFLSALGALFTLSLGLWAEQLVRELLERNTVFGYLALALTAIIAIALAALILREILGLMRIGTINRLREEAEAIEASGSLKQARKLVLAIGDLCETLPETAAGRAALKEHAKDILEPGDLLALTETRLMGKLDERARTLVLNSAKRVSIVTAVSPRALVDILFVLSENLRLIRQLSELYGGRPGTIGLLRLARMVVTHLAATGAIAVGDGIIQQFIGHGLAARLSSRLGEGVINGLLTARIGISAMDICRPMPFSALKRPGVGDFMAELVRFSPSEQSNKAG